MASVMQRKVQTDQLHGAAQTVVDGATGKIQAGQMTEVTLQEAAADLHFRSATANTSWIMFKQNDKDQAMGFESMSSNSDGATSIANAVSCTVV